MVSSGNAAEKIVEPETEEPSMDEILASIRQIISNDEETPETREDFTHPESPSNSNAEVNASDDAGEALHSTVIDDLDREMEAAVAAELNVPVDQAEEPFAEKLDAQNDDIQQQAEEVRRQLSSAGAVTAGMTLEERLSQFRNRTQDNKDAALAGSVKTGGLPEEPQEEPQKAPQTMELPVFTPPEPKETARALLDAQSGAMSAEMEEMMRPMVREWVADNLPTLVERLVREEIERVSRSRKG